MSQLPKEVQEVLNHAGQLCQQSDQARKFGNLELAKFHRLNATIFLLGKQSEIKHPLLTREVAVIWSQLANIREEMGDYEGAQFDLENSLTNRELLVDETGDAQSKRDLCFGLNGLGVFERNHGKNSKAREYFKRFLEIAEELVKTEKTRKAMEDYSLAHLRLGDLDFSIGKYEDALGHFKECIETDLKLDEQNRDYSSMNNLRMSACRNAEAFARVGIVESAVSFIKGCMATSKTIFQKVQTEEEMSAYNHYLDKAFDVFCSVQKWDDAVANRQERASFAKAVYDQTGNPDDLFQHSVAIAQCGDALFTAKNYSKALINYQSFLDIGNQLHEDLDNENTALNVASGCEKYGATLLSMELGETAREYLEKCLEMRSELLEGSDDLDSKRSLAAAQQWMGMLEDDCGNLDEAIDHFSKDVAISREILNESRNYRNRADLAKSLEKQAGVERKMGLSAKSHSTLFEAHELYKTSADKRPTPETILPLLQCKLTFVEHTQGEEQRQWLENAKGYFELFVQRYPFFKVPENLKDGLAKLGIIKDTFKI